MCRWVLELFDEIGQKSWQTAGEPRVTIPKILHFTWKTDNVPGRMGEYLAMWRESHADWDIRLWTDATMRTFVAAQYPDFLAIYDGYGHPIQRADSFRYLVLNILGGVYSDLDVEPHRSINEMVAGLDCFVGIEPFEHIGPDRRHSGAPFLLSNAFMGAMPGHAYFRTIVELLPIVADTPDIFYSTGPSLTTGAALRLPQEARPALIPPCLWSPHCDGGKPCTSDDQLHEVLWADFDFVWADRQAFVSHHWMTTWVPFLKRHKWLAKPFHALHAAKWALRARRFPKLAELPILDQLVPFNDQVPKPPKILPKVAVCISLLPGEQLSDELAKALVALDYPKELLTFYVGGFDLALAQSAVARLRALGCAHAEALAIDMPDEAGLTRLNLLPENVRMAHSACLRNGLFRAVGAQNDWLLFVGGLVGFVPPEALKSALACGYPIVGLGMLNADGAEADFSTHRYHWGGGIRVSYKIRGADGLANAARGQRDFLSGQKAFRLVPLDGVGRGFALINRAVFAAGVGFAETPYNLHLDGEALVLKARERGFECAGMTGIAVRGCTVSD